MRKPLLFLFFTACSTTALGDGISDNFKSMAKALKIAADVGDRCLADYQATKDKAQCDRFELVFNDFRLKQKAWQKSFHGDVQLAEGSATKQEFADFKSDGTRLAETLSFIGEREDEFPLK